MSVSLQDIRDIAYGILREEEDTSAYPLVLMDSMINTAYMKICNGRVVNPLTKEEVMKGILPFLNKDMFYSSIQSTNLTADTSVGSGTLEVNDTSNFASSGELYINGNIITYTGTTATTFTGCTGVFFDFKASSKVYPVYSLPTDYGSVLNVIYNNKFKLEAKLYDDIYEDLNGLKGSYIGRNNNTNIYDNPYSEKPFYSIKDRKYLLIYQLDQNDNQILMRYEAIPTELTDSDDTFLIDIDIYVKSTIPYLAVGELLYNRGEEQRASELINYGLGNIKEMYTYYNNSSYEKISGKSYKMGKGRLNI